MGDSADSDADDPLFCETGADMSRWLSRRDADEVGPDLAPVPVPAAMCDDGNWSSDHWAASTDCESANDLAVATSAAVAVPPPRASCSSASSGIAGSLRGKYVRDTSTGRGIRRSWPDAALQHLETVLDRSGDGFMANGDHCKHVFSFTMIRGCTSSKCIDKISRADVSACHRISYGEPHADLGGVPTASNWPTTHNHATTQLLYELIRSTLRDGAFKFALGLSGQSVCAAMWRAAYDVPLSTFEAMCRAASKNEPVWAPDVLTNTALSKAAGSVKDSETTMSFSVAWWAERLLWHDFMPHTTGQHGRIVADVTEWVDVYNNNFVPELSAAGMASFRPAWYKARNRALQDLADTTYGPSGLPFQLVVRRKNITFKECDTCARLKLMHKEALRGREVAEIEKAQRCMRAHSSWWMAQRVKLDQYRLAGRGADTIFEQADGCGEDCLNIPSFPRACSSNASGKWKLKQKLHATLYAGKQFTLLFTPPTVASGANFGVMAVLNGLANVFDSGLIPATKRTFVRGTDGGSENRCKVGHGMNAMLVQVGVVDCLLWARLPPNHSHNAVDRMFSAVEK